MFLLLRVHNAQPLNSTAKHQPQAVSLQITPTEAAKLHPSEEPINHAALSGKALAR
jgi:hypothetical protein